jgi:hypothetical protein
MSEPMYSMYSINPCCLCSLRFTYTAIIQICSMLRPRNIFPGSIQYNHNYMLKHSRCCINTKGHSHIYINCILSDYSQITLQVFRYPNILKGCFYIDPTNDPTTLQSIQTCPTINHRMYW